MEEKRKQALQLLYNFLKNTTTCSVEEFIQKMKKIALYQTQNLADQELWFKIFGREQFYNLENYIYQYKDKITSNNDKIKLYKQINNIIQDFLKNYSISNKKINTHIHQELNTCIDDNNIFINNEEEWHNLVNNINVVGLHNIINTLIKQDFENRKDFYYKKVKSWINSFYEAYLLDQKKDNYNPIVNSLEELKNINKIGEEFDISKDVIYEIDYSVKDKFVWIPNKFITSDDGYGIHHAQMMTNLVLEHRNQQIDKDRTDFISNARQPEDLNIKMTEEEKRIPALFGSYYFNKEIAVIEGKYLISRGDNNYNTALELLKKKFKHANVL